MIMPKKIINPSAEEKLKRSKAFLYNPSCNKLVSDTIEINGIIAEIPIVSTRENPIIIKSIKSISIFCLLVSIIKSFERTGFKNVNFSNNVIVFQKPLCE